MASLEFDTEKKIFRDYYNDNIDLLHNAESSYATLIKSLLVESAELSSASITSRVKDREECIKKFSRKYQTKLEEDKIKYEIKDHITDIIGIRIICLYEKNINEIGDLLKDNFFLIEETDKVELIEKTENIFGYKGLHLDLEMNGNRKKMPEYSIYKDIQIEVQIRTIIQDAWSVLDHKIKYKKSIPHDLKRRINSLAALFETADREFYSIREETEKLENEEAQSSTESKEDKLLNAFNFSKIITSRFPEYSFYSHKIDGFVDEILNYKQISENEFSEIFEKEFDTVDSYKIDLGGDNALNPFTIIRHILYLNRRTEFSRILYDYQRSAFDFWLKENI